MIVADEIKAYCFHKSYMEVRMYPNAYRSISATVGIHTIPNQLQLALRKAWDVRRRL